MMKKLVTIILLMTGCGIIAASEYRRPIVPNIDHFMEYLQLLVIESKIDRTDFDVLMSSAGLSSQLDVINSKIDGVDIEGDAILQAAEAASSKTSVVESKADLCCENTTSELAVIESKADNLSSDLGLLALALALGNLGIESQLSTVESKADACCSLQTSLIEVIDVNAATGGQAAEAASSKTSVVESKADLCCENTTSRLDLLQVDMDRSFASVVELLDNLAINITSILDIVAVL